MGRGRGSDCDSWGGDGVCIGDRGGTTGGTWSCESCSKADGKITAWLLVSGAGAVDGICPNNEEGSKNNGKGECDLSHALFCLIVALTLSAAHSITP